MVLLNKKRILFVTLITLTGIIYTNLNLNQNTQEVSAIPVVNKTIILDAGHGIPDEGAVARDGTSEESINLEIVLKLQEILEISGCKVVLTRSDENGIYEQNKDDIKNKKISDMKKRVEIGNNSEADIFVSIHLNKFSEEKYNGFQTFYKESNEESKKLAKLIQESLKETVNKDNKREALSISNKYIIDNVVVPTVIVECGFLSNEEELENLKKEEYQEKIAWGIYYGILDFFNYD